MKREKKGKLYCECGNKIADYECMMGYHIICDKCGKENNGGYYGRERQIKND